MKVSLFITCLSDAIYPKVGETMMRLLAKYGIVLDFPNVQACCGQPAFNSGYWQEAKAAAKTVLTAFEDSDFIVTPSGSCAHMVYQYTDLFRDEPEWGRKAQQLQKKMFEFTQFLVNVLGITDLGARFPHKVTYHPSCHGSRLLGVKHEPMELIRHVRDLQLVPLPFAEDCCGFGGTFAIKMSNISGAMVAEKCEHVLQTEAEVLVGLDMGCMMNIAGHLRYYNQPVRVMHLAELLYEGVCGSNE